MKQTIILIFLLCSSFLIAQNVGINTITPDVELDIRSIGDDAPSSLRIANPSKSRYLELFSGGAVYPDPLILWPNGRSLIFASDENVFTERMRINNLGKVGIRIPNPEAQLDIRGGDWNLDAGNPGDLRIGNAPYNLRIGVATGGGGAGISRIYSSSHLILGSADQPQVRIDTEGKTGFGTNNPNQKVHINGKLKVGDDTRVPSEGTIRYNDSQKSFQGYDGTKWINLGGSSPYGHQGTFNLPNTTFGIDIEGDAKSIRSDGEWIVIRSQKDVLVGYSTSFPPMPIYETVTYIQVYDEDSNGNWDESLAINSMDLGSDAYLGTDFDISNNRLLVGDPVNKKVYEYSKIFTFWSLTKTFESPNTAIADRFGSSVAMDGSQTIIGAPARYSFFTPVGSGKAYVYDALNNLEGTLSGPGAAIGDGFGSSVDITTNRAIVGAPYNDIGSASDSGSATVFNKFNGNWSTNATFYSQTATNNDNFGSSVVLDGDHFCVRDHASGINSYLVEDGYWVLKELINGEGINYSSGAPHLIGTDKLLATNYSSASDQLTYITAYERDVNGYFILTSSLLLGDAKFKSYDETDDAVYVLNDDDEIVVFEY